VKWLPRSLTLRLTLGIGVALALLWSASAAWMLHDLDRSIGQALDRRLAMSAEMVAGLVGNMGGALAPGSRLASGPVTIPRQQAVACQVRSLRGEILATTANAPQDVLGRGIPGYGMAMAGGVRWRTYTLVRDGLVISTADRMGERDALARHVALVAGLPFAIAGLGGLGLLWWGLGRGLAPLRLMSQRIAGRSSAQPTVLPTAGMPTELAALAGVLNESFERDARAFERERAFASSAAHELRTPLTVIDTHLQVARLDAGPRGREALDDARQGALRMRAIIEDLLLLARLDASEPLPDDAEPLRLQTLLSTALDGSEAGSARVALQVHPGLAMLHIPGRAALWTLALANLVDNALKYSDGPVRVEVTRVDATVHIAVSDQGPGMDPELATRRFWRHGSVEGHGLGLPLAQAIAKRLGGRLSIESSAAGSVCVLALPLKS